MLEERKLQKCKITLMRNPKFALLQGVMMVGKTHINDMVPTACTNGRDEIYGRGFVKKLPERELAFVIAHEAGHKMYRHLSTWKKLHDEDARLANSAMDYVINLMLKDLDPTESIIAMPRLTENIGKHKKGDFMGLIDERFRGMNTKQVYDILKQEKKDEGEGGGEGDGEGGGDGFDDHDWDGADKLTDEEKKELAREIDQAIRQGLMAHQKQIGKGAGGLDRELEDLLAPKIDWREVLREFVKATCANKDTSSWRRVNRRFLSTGTYMPSMIGEKVGHLVVAIDTSGSIGGPELAEFLSEVQGIAEEVSPEVVDLIYWDGDIAAHEKYEGSAVSNIVSSTKPKGGGGTDPSCVSKYLRDENIKPECVIVLTDGYVPNWGDEWTAPTMWVISGGNTSAVSEHGKTIYLED
jgi:predicted metal-dependent peptidase